MTAEELLKRYAADEWHQYPSGYRKLAGRIIQTTMVFQASIGDERDLQQNIIQSRVDSQQRQAQRSALRRAIDEIFGRKPRRRKIVPKVIESQQPQQYIDGLPM